VKRSLISTEHHVLFLQSLFSGEMPDYGMDVSSPVTAGRSKLWKRQPESERLQCCYFAMLFNVNEIARAWTLQENLIPPAAGCEM